MAGGPGDPFLLVAGAENHRSVARADVVALAIADARRIENDLACLGVIAVIAIGGVRDAAAGVAHPRRQYAFLAANQLLTRRSSRRSERHCLPLLRHLLHPWTSSIWVKY